MKLRYLKFCLERSEAERAKGGARGGMEKIQNI
jgi:hypothetical protein